MFIQANDIDGSPLQYALGISDIFTLKIFYYKALTNPEHLISFNQQAENQKSTVNLDFLYNAYEAFKQQYRVWENLLKLNKMQVPGTETITEQNWWGTTTQREIIAPLAGLMWPYVQQLRQFIKS